MSVIERKTLIPDPDTLSNKELVDRIYTLYVLFTAYNELVKEIPELGWLSRHNEASEILYERFESMRIAIVTARLQRERIISFRFGSPVIKEAILDIKLEFLRNDIFTAEQAVPFIGELLKTHPALIDLEKKVSLYKSSVNTPRVRLVRRRVKPLVAPKAA